MTIYLRYRYNLYLVEGVFPTRRKEAIDSPFSCRLVCLLITEGKVLKRLSLNKLHEHIEEERTAVRIQDRSFHHGRSAN